MIYSLFLHVGIPLRPFRVSFINLLGYERLMIGDDIDPDRYLSGAFLPLSLLNPTDRRNTSELPSFYYDEDLQALLRT